MEIPGILETFRYTNFQKIGLELDVLPFNLYAMYKKIFPSVEFTDISPVIKGIRAVKSLYEIELLRNALGVVDQTFLTVPSLL